MLSSCSMWPNHLMHSDGAASDPAGDEPCWASMKLSIHMVLAASVNVVSVLGTL